jgi:ADP-heptose:LPS heptosyltransferase
MVQAYSFIRGALAAAGIPVRQGRFAGVRVTLSDDAVKQARQVLSHQSVPARTPVILFNPDASSPFTCIPFRMQVSLLRQLAELPCFILIGAGHTFRNIGVRLIDTLGPASWHNLALVPASLSFDGYAALIDRADAFITADTGLLHIAAARKVSASGRHSFRNATAIFSVFGPTPARMYGYRSDAAGYFPSYQDAPSNTYVAGSFCRNITCINKQEKTCATVRCFDFLNIDKIVLDVQTCLKNSCQPESITKVEIQP